MLPTDVAWFSHDRFKPERGEHDRDLSENITRAFDVLRTFGPGQAALSHAQLGRLTGLPKATISRLTYTLTRLGYLEYAPATRRYRLAPGILAVGYPLLANIKLRQAARPLMKDLSEFARGTVAMATRWRSSMIYLDVHIGHRAAAFQPEIGATVPILGSAIGRGWLVGQPRPEQDEVVNLVTVAEGADRADSVARLKRARQEYLKKGFVVAKGEYQAGVHAVAVPLKPSADDYRFVFSCGVPAAILKGDALEQSIGPRLVEMVRELENEIAQHRTTSVPPLSRSG